MLRATLCSISLSLVPATRAAAQEATPPTWFAEFDLAAEAAQAADKDLLVSFRGSDWCEFCTLLEDEVFGQEAWSNAAEKDYILVALDFPQGEEARKLVPDAARNTELADQYSVTQFPTVLLMDPSGVVFGELGYEEGGAERYVALMDALQTTGKRILRETAVLKQELTQARDHKALAGKAIALLNDAVQGTQGLVQLAEWARLAYQVDPDNKDGLKLRAVQAILLTAQASNEDFPIAIELDPKNQRGLNEQAAVARMDTIQTEEQAHAWVDHVLSLRTMSRLHEAPLIQELAVYAAVFCRDYLDRMDDATLLATWVRSLGKVPADFAETIDSILQEA